MSARALAALRNVAAQSGEPVGEQRRRPATLVRRERIRAARVAPIIAYDFETTRIEPGTPRPLYLTAYSESPEFAFESAIESVDHLHLLLTTRFLVPEFLGARFVAWAGNKFDAYFIAAALVGDERYVMRPYLTRSNALRGLRVLPAADADKPRARAWEFLDGIAMTGLVGTSLDKFLSAFAPLHRKFVGVIDFEKEEFDAMSSAHRAYAMRDSVGLWHGMRNAQSILVDRFQQPLGVTMGGACIRIFQAHLPRAISVPTPRDDVLTIIREHVMRGGFCYCVERYCGPIWKYDLNQAYAAAMREADLPCGFTSRVDGAVPADARAWIVRIEATNARNTVPFYYRTEIGGRIRSVFGVERIAMTWLTSLEYEQLVSEGWIVTVHESWVWDSAFRMSEFVDKLETGRRSADGGPSGAIGTVYKAVGNHAYGKTVEQLEPIEYLLAATRPDGYLPYYGDDSDPMPHVWFRFVDDPRPKAYHQPQIGAFITAHVRMVVRRAALHASDAWIYADTDCVVFTRDVSALLDIDSSRYGAWKIEEAGAEYRVIAKKVYASVDGSKRSAKGLNVRCLSAQDFENWYEGISPVQEQVQRQNFLAVMRGAEMFRKQVREGTNVERKRK